ncbi:MAG TPA: type IV toxin-antitoxin system AbiEi family antitoxin domain-containing protein [Intrasporangiaceae bacterium]|nr:type IV toxin-antitoxin system AbiEi family antitoxin domain-containing protein [Intrasporangiaceae bacterium]
MAQAHFGVFSAEDAAAVGVGSQDLAVLIRHGRIVRVRRGAYVLSEVYRAAELDEQYALRVLAVMRTRPRTDRASHHSALALYKVATFGVPTDLILLEGEVTRSRQNGGVLIHPRSAQRTGGTVKDLHCVSAALGCVQVAARYGFEAGLCAMDSALHRKACTSDELHAAVEFVARPWRAGVLRALAMTDPLCESVGETRTRIILRDAGYSVRSQVDITSGEDFLGRVDFLVDDCVVVEFDGLVKYAGKDGKHALAEEKDRETRITWLGYPVVRLVWSDLKDPIAVIRKVEEAKRRALRMRSSVG